ncbi:MAG: extracellular solute-binding protein [Deltaproteobacteria bacterium]|nr:extracellular solute-binding protein [Deltaproteobacteria bacterium]
MAGGVFSTRVKSEKPNIQADIAIGATIAQAVEMKREGLLQVYKSNAWASIPDEFKDKDGYFYCDSMWTPMPVVNTKLIKKKGLPIPTSWYDLTDPKWKGEIAMPNPMTSSSAYLTLLGLVRLMGEDQAFEFLKKLHQNVSQYTKSGGAPALLVSRGEVTFGITDTTSAYARIQEGFPIATAPPKEGVAYSLAANCIFASTKDPQKLEAAKKVIDFIGSKEYQDFAGTFRPKVTNPQAIGLESKYGKIKLVDDFDIEWVIANKKRLQNKWKEYFQNQ